MGKAKVNISVYFRYENTDHFILKILNIGRCRDDIKFTFHDPNAGIRSIYTEQSDVLDGSILIRRLPELTYHSDGSLLFKLVGDVNDPRTIQKNPHGEGFRRTPLNQVTSWNPFAKYTVRDYSLCRRIKPKANILIMPGNDYVFSGLPFVCLLMLGSSAITAAPSSSRESILRVPNVAEGVDLLIAAVRDPEPNRRFWNALERRWRYHINNQVEVVV